MTPTLTLRVEHFEYFSVGPIERDPAQGSKITELLVSLWGAVAQKVGPDRFRKDLGHVRAGNLGKGDDWAWAQTNADEKSDLPNLTIEINKDELSLNVVGVFVKQAGHVKRWLEGTRGRALADADYKLVVRCVTGQWVGPHGTRVMWRGAKQEEVGRVPLGDLQTTTITIDELLAPWLDPLDRRIQHLGFHIRKAWNRTDATGRTDLRCLLAREIDKKLIAVLREIRGA